MASNSIPVRQASLCEQVFRIIFKSISEGEFPPGSRLPSENELADRFEVSRPTIRAALARLAERGYVKKKQGVGTFVADSQTIVNPLYRTYNMEERIEARGYSPGFRQLHAQIIEADEELSDKLDIAVGSNVLSVHKIFTADDQPIIYFINYIPEWVYESCLTQEEALKPGITEPFFLFFSEMCNKEIQYLASIIQPKLSKECDLPEQFAVDDSEEPLLVVEDLGYDENDNVLVYSIEHLAREASNFHVVRRVENI